MVENSHDRSINQGNLSYQTISYLEIKSKWTLFPLGSFSLSDRHISQLLFLINRAIWGQSRSSLGTKSAAIIRLSFRLDTGSGKRCKWRWLMLMPITIVRFPRAETRLERQRLRRKGQDGTDLMRARINARGKQHVTQLPELCSSMHQSYSFLVAWNVHSLVLYSQ